MATTVQNILDKVKRRTHHTRDTEVLAEIQSAADWLFNRLFNTENGPNLLSTYGIEKTLSAYTREYDVAANVTGFFAIKALWLKLPGDTVFTPMISQDTTGRKFIVGDNMPASDTTTVATGHPVYFNSINFGSVRFSPALPANSVLKIDHYKKPNLLDPTTNNDFTSGTDLPEACSEVLASKATAQVFENLDDDRSATWEARAHEQLQDLFYGLNRRFQGPVTMTPFKTRRPRVI